MVIRSVDADRADEQRTPPAERPRTAEEELARGRIEQTPFSLISWVGLALALLVAVALVLVVVAYVLA